MQSTLLSVLQHINQGNYIPEATLAHTLGITSAAVARHLTQLRHYGLAIDFDARQGYRLQQPLDLLNVQALQSSLSCPGATIDYFVSVDSTNDYLLRNTIRSSYPHICIAEHQTNGRGRLNSSWIAPFAANILLSIKNVFNKNVQELSGLSLVVAVIIVETLTNLYDSLELHIKWPNDVYLHGKKLSGNIVEINTEIVDQTAIIIGIGINVNMVTESHINQPWISLQHVIGHAVDRLPLVRALINNLFNGLLLFEKAGFYAFSSTYRRYDYLYGKELTLLLTPSSTIIQGRGVGVSELGQLQLDTPDGLQCFASGEARLVKNLNALSV